MTILAVSDGQSCRTLVAKTFHPDGERRFYVERMWWVRLGEYIPEVGLARPVDDVNQPWHGEWWKG